MTLPPKRAPAPSLGLARAAAAQGDWITAHRIALLLTREDPDDEAAWLLAATTAQSVEEALLMLGHVLKLNPGNAEARQAFHEAMKERLRRDAYLAYNREGETAEMLYAHTANNLEIALPRRAALPPVPAPPGAEPASRWLGWAIAGLLPAGLGALPSAPLAMLHALRLLAGRDPEYRRQGLVILGLAAATLLLGITYAAIMILHLSS